MASRVSKLRNCFHTSSVVCHDNPLGLPVKGTPPTLRMARGLPTKSPIKGVKHVVAVASGKGGVGKSTTAGTYTHNYACAIASSLISILVNLAVALASQNITTGLLDADLFGPSIPRMMNLNSTPETTPQNLLRPLTNYGVKCMSMGFLIDRDAPIVWRGLMVMKALEQLLRQVEWGVDVLVVDMPPGTGDTQLTVSQSVVVDGAVIVSTPQDVALGDVRKGVNMFRKVGIPIFGLVQNMSLYHCPNCSHTSYIFGNQDHLLSTANSMDLDILANIPLHPDVCATSDAGTPIVIAQPTSVHAEVYQGLARKVADKLGLQSSQSNKHLHS
ncbi:hypothetical protein SpCBS45565_g02531 [Spizellomyces sp. 'palustris']|nr:hypothetical protein SpCBS45565_g02531 [Spizellomyces sp. 'palustris']